MRKAIVLSAIIFLGLGFYSVAYAVGQDLSGYIYSRTETIGWISLNCTNTNSCDSVNYKVSEDDGGKLSGYGYSQNGEWINFNPNFGGVSANSDGSFSGWIFADKDGWINLDSAKNVSVSDLQNDVASVESTITDNNLSESDAMSLLNGLCNKFLPASECAEIVNF